MLLLAPYAESTFIRYRSSTRTFLKWCKLQQLPAVSTVDHLDELVARFIQRKFDERGGVGFNNAANLVHGLVMFMPRLKGRLPLSNRSLLGWRKLRPPQPHPPLTRPLACAIAVELARMGMMRYAVATLLAFDALLRVNEFMNLRVEDVILPDDRRLGAIKPLDASSDSKAAYTGAAIRLRFTKTGTEQFVTIRDKDVIFLLRLAMQGLKPWDYLFPASSADRAASFRRAFSKARDNLRLDKRFVPHSLRHGGATYLKLCGWSVDDIRERGRWKATDSAFHYIQSGRALLLVTRVPPHLLLAAETLGENVLASLSIAQKRALRR